jgi:hypothetical protein
MRPRSTCPRVWKRRSGLIGRQHRATRPSARPISLQSPKVAPGWLRREAAPARCGPDGIARSRRPTPAGRSSTTPWRTETGARRTSQVVPALRTASTTFRARPPGRPVVSRAGDPPPWKHRSVEDRSAGTARVSSRVARVRRALRPGSSPRFRARRRGVADPLAPIGAAVSPTGATATVRQNTSKRTRCRRAPEPDGRGGRGVGRGRSIPVATRVRPARGYSASWSRSGPTVPSGPATGRSNGDRTSSRGQLEYLPR